MAAAAGTPVGSFEMLMLFVILLPGRDPSPWRPGDGPALEPVGAAAVAAPETAPWNEEEEGGEGEGEGAAGASHEETGPSEGE